MCMDAGRYTPAANLWQELAALHESRIPLLEHETADWKKAVEAATAGFKKVQNTMTDFCWSSPCV